MNDLPELSEEDFKREVDACGRLAFSRLQTAICEYMATCYDTKDFRVAVAALSMVLNFLQDENAKFIKTLSTIKDFDDLREHYHLSEADLEKGRQALETTRTRLAIQRN